MARVSSVGKAPVQPAVKVMAEAVPAATGEIDFYWRNDMTTPCLNLLAPTAVLSERVVRRFTVKRLTALALLSVASTALMAQVGQDTGRVVSSTPIVTQVGVPRQVCTTEQVEVMQPKSGAGAAMGAIAGGALANAATHGSGQAAATMIGIIGGAVIGDRIEGPPTSQLQNVQRCATQTFYEARTTGYNVVYEYAGKHHSVQLPQDPGPTIALQVQPIGMVPQAQVTYSQNPPVVVQQQRVVVQGHSRHYPYNAYPNAFPLQMHVPPVVVWRDAGDRRNDRHGDQREDRRDDRRRFEH